MQSIVLRGLLSLIFGHVKVPGMRYSELADIYEKLEGTSKKLEKAKIIAELLKAAPTELLPKLVLLLNGRVYPIWGAVELGVADRMMTKVIAKGVGESEEKVVKQVTKVGDLGKTAEFFVKERKQRALGRKYLTVEEVFEKLRKVAEQTGSGSQERKLGLVVELLAQAEPKEARYLVRIALGQLRVGVAEGIMRDAIAEAFKIDADTVEGAWFVHPDYGKIAEIAKKKGVKGLEKVELELGVPLMVQLAEKAPDLKTALESFERPVLEYKYDGARLVVHRQGDKVWIYTRRLEDVTAAFPDVVDAVKKAVASKEFVIEGEGLGINPKTGKPLPFQRLSQRIKRKYGIKEAAKEIPVDFHVFDILHLNGKTFFDRTLAERFEILSRTIKPIPGKIEFAHRLVTKDLKQAEAFYKKALADGQEGLIVKNLDAKYSPGRRVAGGWLKVKPTLENLDLVIVGALWGTGKRGGFLGSMILGARDPDTGKFLACGMMGSGIKEKEAEAEKGELSLTSITKMLRPLITKEYSGGVWVKPKIVIEIAYEEIQKSPSYESGFALRFPRLVRLRPDKAPEEADTIDRLQAIYEIQKGKKPAETGEK
jgi:DNA ligase-1